MEQSIATDTQVVMPAQQERRHAQQVDVMRVRQEVVHIVIPTLA